MKWMIVIAWRLLLLVVFGVIVINVIIYWYSKDYIFKDATEVPSAHVVMIPGASVMSSGELSPIFRDRVDLALELYELGKVSKILVSGDNSTLSYNEVNPVKNYLLNRGVPEDDIFLDHAGFDTYSSMYRARDIFSVSSMIVSSQSFHLPRSIFLAKSLGIEEVYGVDTDAGNILFRNHIRETLAKEKAMINLIFKRTPKFLGEKIPIP